MAMTAQEYLDTFNAAINSGAYEDAARVLRQAEGEFGPGVYDVAGVVLEANPNLPQEIDYMSPQGIQSIRDYVASVPSPVTAVSPALNLVNTLPEAGLIPSGNVSGTGAGVVSSGPPVGSLENPAVQSPIQLGPVPATRVMTRPEQEEAFTQIYAQTQVDDFVDAVLRGASTGDFSEAAGILSRNAANPLFGEDVYGVASNLLNTDPRFAGLREQVGGAAYTPENLRSFVTNQLAVQEAGATPGATPEGAPTGVEGAPAAPTGRTIAGIPTYARQEYTPRTFAPVRRGIAQLRPAMYMPGLTSGQAPLGGSGFTPEALRTASEGLSPADRAYLMDVGGVSPAELSAATGTPVGQLQAEYNQLRPGGLFGTAAPATTALPKDFVLQTGAYGAPIANPIALTPPTSASAPTPESSFEDQMGYLSNMYLGRPLSPSELSTYRTDFGGTLNRENINDFLSRSQEEMGNRLLVGTNPEAANTQGVKAGGVIKMAEGGEAMAKLSPAEAGSKFDVSEFIDEQGRLVGGYSRPIRDEFGVITGYDYQPYQRDVVFNPRLAEAEARGMSDEEREAARRGLIVRQGMTGVDPYAGGLAGIVAREAMMRNRPQYYSYAKGGLADVAQDLADKGRFGDTMVAHISPQEAGLLKALGGSGTINPQTGLPEFFSLFPKKGIKLNLGPLGNVKIGAKSSNIIQAAAALAAGDVMGLTAGQAALAYGGVRAAATGNLMEGIQAGLTAYGMGNMYQGLSGTTIGTPATPAPIDTIPVGSGGVPTGVEAPIVSSQQAPLTASLPDASTVPGSTNLGAAFSPTDASYIPAGGQAAPQAVAPGVTQAGTEAAKQGFLERTLPPSVKEYIPQPILDASGTTLATGTLLGSSLIAGQQERGALAAAQADEERKRRERNARYQALFNQTLGQVRPAKAGGLMKLAGGGMTYMEAGGTTGPTGTPRDVTGTGDGMSDSVPATIEGVQEARLADGEFVIPADVVADIGNGSSDAGSKKLYDMMDRIRMARHGTKEQPPEIKAERLMPA